MSVADTSAARPTRRRATWGVLALLVLVGLSAVAFLIIRASTAARVGARARYAVDQRKFDEARTFIRTMLANDPRSGEAHYLLARVALAEGDGQKVINELAQAMELGYPTEKLAPYRAVIMARSEQYAEAEPILRNALAASDEPQPEIAEALARIYLSTFRLKQAGAPIERWMRDAPDDPRPYLFRNEIDTRSDADHSVVIQNYREALKRDPNLAVARLGLADRLLQAHRLDEAAEEFHAYQKLKPDDPEGFTGAGRVKLEQGKREDAARFFQTALRLDPKELIALKELGIIELGRGNLRASRDLLERVIKIDPFDPDTHFNLSRVLRLQKDPDGAKVEEDLAQKLRAEHARMADIRSSLVKRPGDVALRLEAAEWLLNHAHEDEGLNWARQILHDHPGHPPTLRMLVDYYTRKKEPGKANGYRMLLRPEEATPKKS